MPRFERFNKINDVTNAACSCGFWAMSTATKTLEAVKQLTEEQREGISQPAA
jgi:hypothetical protein